MLKRTKTSMKIALFATLLPLSLGASENNWLIQHESSIFTFSLVLASLGVYVGLPLYYSKTGTTLEDTDPFKQMVLQEFQKAGLSCDTPWSVVVSVEAEANQMLAVRNGIVVAQSIYEAYQNGKADINRLRFLLRHEATHLKHNDVLKRMAWFTALCATGGWGIDYFMKSTNMNECILKGIYKHAIIQLVWPIINYNCNYHQEMRADREAAADTILATAGAQLFENLEERIEKCGAFERWIQTQPFLFRLLAGYQTFRERAETLKEIAETSTNDQYARA